MLPQAKLSSLGYSEQGFLINHTTMVQNVAHSIHLLLTTTTYFSGISVAVGMCLCTGFYSSEELQLKLFDMNALQLCFEPLLCCMRERYTAMWCSETSTRQEKEQCCTSILKRNECSMPAASCLYAVFIQDDSGTRLKILAAREH